ncbi:P-type conjugative transfer protein VirB9 [Pseudomonas syringae pv. syringae]|uniref:P-type conjugative transfer protein VirB9 n=1 Tax=Pseudomonas syringae TaxID=317 RepID=UPI00200A3C25|nr:P-type conjugative transfer protein VirB9 [Pseudomonas syringae]MCK9699847.1 P-type conjugative transfer protein VirB9 [Pseudomonas syringae pv. syringae]MCK9724725.1 P-type conjugative transfer protein VirB9 [Pseudomonas syringae pv. syringae]
MVNKAVSGLTALLFLTSGLPAYAESMGTGSALDRRVQTAIYSPDEVFRVQATVGRGALVQLQSNETINQDTGLMVSGDPKAWSIGPNKAGNMVSLKPITDKEPDTNLTINTNRRTYLIELKLVERTQDSTYLLRFTYPEPPKKAVAARRDPGNPCDGPVQNGTYQKRSNAESKSIGPYEGWDNGMLTCFRFTGNGPRPVLYQVLPDGTETVADMHNEQNVIVVHGVSRLFRFRLNGLLVEARPTAQVNTGYNFNGTTTGEIRELKHAEQ